MFEPNDHDRHIDPPQSLFAESADSIAPSRLKKFTQHAVGPVVLAAALVAVYGPSLNTPFIFDDEESILENQSIVKLWPLIGDARHPGPLNPPSQHSTAGRPLANLSLAINYRLAEYDPFGYHLFNVIVHFLSALLVGAIVRRMLQLDFFQGRFDRAGPWLALLAMLLWALHPLQIEAVIYITQRTELLVGFFYLATFYASLRYWKANSHTTRIIWCVSAFFACLAGMASKEVMVTAPVMVLLFERTFLTGTFRQALRKSGPLYCGLFASWGLLIALNISGPRSGTAGFDLGLSAYSWWFTQAKVLWMYLKLVIWPHPLVIHYAISYLTSFSSAWPWVLGSIALGLVACVLTWRRSAIGLALAWIILILLPTLLVPITTEVAAERRMYLPLAALVTLFVAGGYQLLRMVQVRLSSSPARSYALPLASIGLIYVALSIACGFVSTTHLEAYQNPVVLWSEAVAIEPNDFLAQYNLGYAMIVAGRSEDGIEHFRKALQLAPKYADAYNDLANALRVSGQLSEAIDNYQHALELKPDFPQAQYNLGLALAQSGNWQAAILHYEQALQSRSDWAEAHGNLGRALAKIGRLDEAIVQLQQALDEKQDYPDAETWLGLTFLQQGQLPEAIVHLQRALQLKPDLPEAENNLGIALKQSGKLKDAIRHYQQAIRLDPKFAEPHNNLANALLQTDKIDEAIEHFQQALQLDPSYAQAGVGLAMAYQKADRPAKAIATGQKAVELARKAGQIELAQKTEAWLSSYRANPTASHSAPPSADSKSSKEQ